jgi:D-tyrosyl-tRNA(Tyr) deacylase
VVQRVSSARVLVRDGTRGGDEIAGEIGLGLLVLLGIARGDGEESVERLARRIASWRCFSDAQGRMNLDVGQVGGALLVVSQFTLVADVERGRRPSFDTAEEPSRAAELVEHFAAFGAHMRVELVNDGPVTFVFEG